MENWDFSGAEKNKSAINQKTYRYGIPLKLPRIYKKNTKTSKKKNFYPFFMPPDIMKN